MRLFVPLLLLAAAFLAGCSGGGSANPPVDDGLKPTDTTGILRGVVYDASITPIAGAAVALQGAGAEDSSTTSNEEGAFGFQDLAPGTYFVKASKPGFDPIQQSADVVAGFANPPLVKIQLIANPATAPYVTEASWTGFIECSLRAGTGPAGQGSVGVNVCSGANNDTRIGNQFTEFPLTELGTVPDLLQAELVWDSTQTLGSGLSFVVGPPTCEDIKYARADGASPLVITLTKSDLEGNNVTAAAGLCFRVFSYTSEESQHLGGVTLSQEFDAYFHGFHNFLPPEGWQFSKDGAPQVPT